MKKETYNNFNWQIPKIVVTLPQGDSAEFLFKEYQEFIKTFSTNDWSRLKYNSNTKEIYNSNSIDQGILNFLLKDSGIRVVVPGDDVHGDVLNLIRGKHYADFNALVVQKDKPLYEKNLGLWKKVIELAEEKDGSVKGPFMIQGFYNIPDKTEVNYGVKIIPASNFKIIEDDRLSEKYNGWNFNNLDEIGLPKDLGKTKGKRIFYIRGDGLSRVCLSWDSGLDARYDNLEVSTDIGRVVFLNDAYGVAPKILSI